MKRLLLLLLALLPLCAHAQSTLTQNVGDSTLLGWTPNLTRANNTPVSNPLTYIVFQQVNGGAWTTLITGLAVTNYRTMLYTTPGNYCYTVREVEAPGGATYTSVPASTPGCVSVLAVPSAAPNAPTNITVAK